MAESKATKHTNSITPLHERDNVCEMNAADCIEEMLGLVKLMYNDTQRILHAINAEIGVYSSMIERAVTQEERDNLSIAQAQAAQKPAVQAKTATAILEMLKTMYKISKDDQDVKDTRMVFLDDMSDLSSVADGAKRSTVESDGADKKSGGQLAVSGNDSKRGNTDSQ